VMGRIQDFLGKLEGVKRTQRGYISRCPAHKDRSPSLSLKETANGDVLLHCFAGCQFGDIIAALDMRASDCFAEGGLSTPKYRARHRAHEVDAELNILTTRYGFSESAAKALVRKALREEVEAAGRISIDWKMVDEANKEVRWVN
jgi:hypothetical protein